ncbi:MAG: DUF309 domain-containing protein [Pirellulaceae bacterium]
MSLPLPDRRFPAYSYVPGKYPHPQSDPLGHSFGHVPEKCDPLTPENALRHATYLWGIQLFNHGYYWEAHETWEQVWHACGRKRSAADYLKGLIKLAAAGVKSREGRPEGVARHASRSAELLRSVKVSLGGSNAAPFGLTLDSLINIAEHVATHGGQYMNTSNAPVAATLPPLPDS